MLLSLTGRQTKSNFGPVISAACLNLVLMRSDKSDPEQSIRRLRVGNFRLRVKFRH